MVRPRSIAVRLYGCGFPGDPFGDRAGTAIAHVRRPGSVRHCCVIAATTAGRPLSGALLRARERRPSSVRAGVQHIV